MIINISEEYGYRHWTADLTEDEFETLKTRWQTMRGLSCFIPVTMIISQAKEIDDLVELNGIKCHIHQCEDSYLEGVDYKIPEDDLFWIDGKSYTDQEILNNLTK